jgi:hypothetical protein
MEEEARRKLEHEEEAAKEALKPSGMRKNRRQRRK